MASRGRVRAEMNGEHGRWAVIGGERVWQYDGQPVSREQLTMRDDRLAQRNGPPYCPLARRLADTAVLIVERRLTHTRRETVAHTTTTTRSTSSSQHAACNTAITARQRRHLNQPILHTASFSNHYTRSLFKLSRLVSSLALLSEVISSHPSCYLPPLRSVQYGSSSLPVLHDRCRSDA